jgi:hypothetical protein
MAIQIRVFTARLRGLFGQRRTGHELEDEIQLHIRMLTDRFILQGMEPDDARAGVSCDKC